MGESGIRALADTTKALETESSGIRALKPGTGVLARNEREIGGGVRRTQVETGETAATRRGVPGPPGPPEAGETSGRTESLQMEPALPTPWSRTWPPQP